MRANHEGRYLAFLVSEHGEVQGVAKVATTQEGRAHLAHEASAIERYAPLLPPPVRAPSVLAASEGLLLLEPMPWRPRARPWELPEQVARALGALSAEGIRHGDAAPWNLLTVPDGFLLCDWEEAGPERVPFEDLLHFLVQGFALVGRPRLRMLLQALGGEGRLGPSVRAFCESAGTPAETLPESAVRYLAVSSTPLDRGQPDERRGFEARQVLRRELRFFGASRPASK
jgi:hypothetical protein